MTTPLLSKTPRRRRRAIFASLVTVSLVAAACGDDDDQATAGGSDAPAASVATSTVAPADGAGQSECAQQAAAFLEDYDDLPTALPESFAPLAAAPEPGGTVIKIVNGAIPSDGFSADTQAQAAEAIGWTAKRIVFDGTVEDLNAKWQQAIAEKPTAITGSGWPAAAIQQPLADAKAAGIIAQLSSVTDEADSFPGFAATANGNAVAKTMGQLHANLVMRDSNCQAKVAIFSLPFPILTVVTDEFRSVLSARCPDCEVSFTEIQPQDLGSPAATNAIVSKLQSDPSVKYVFTIIGNVAAGLTTALDQANITGVKIFGEVPDENSIAALQEGKNAWWLTQTSQINGWMELDAVLRAIEAGAPVNTTGNPIGILTPDNVPRDTADVPIFPANYQDLFKALWQVG